MITIKVILRDLKPIDMQFREPVSVRTIADQVQPKCPYRLVLARFDRITIRMDTTLYDSGTLELLDIRNMEARLSYQASLLLLYSCAMHEVAGKECRISTHNSLSKGLYTTIRGVEITDELVQKVEDRMRELVEQKLPISKRYVLRHEITMWNRKEHNEKVSEMLRYTPDLQYAMIYTLRDESWTFINELVTDTGYLDLFELRQYKYGILVRFPHPLDPSRILPYEEQNVMYEAFAEEKRWCKITKVFNTKDLNRAILEGRAKELVFMNEALHEKKVAEIADRIASEKKRVILIAGPSSSGKTTFANRLCIQLRVAGLDPLYIGMDDYFHDRDRTPIRDGKYDFECFEAIDTDLMKSHIRQLLSGEEVDMPSFDFEKGEKRYGKRIVRITEDSPIVIEGLHALNPKTSDTFTDDEKFRIYISPLTQLNIDGMNRIPTTDGRILRRIVRDARFRGYSAQKTIDIWPRVSEGEDVNIFPYNKYADEFFNSQCIYEMAVLKKYAKPLLEAICEDQPEFTEAQRLLRLLTYFVSMADDSFIPNNSIMREFIGGSSIV
ncbi:MAG: nucleoside kinase [Solobacterium sp.]|nr:nucleoside kinase [Solobacterium sp.]